MKIAVIGYSGGGKSTLAAALGQRYRLPVLHLDRVHWLPGWVEQAPETEQRAVSAFLDSHGAWIIDGNYASLSLARRLEEADEIVFLAFGRFRCLYRVWKRRRDCAGSARPSMTPGCEEKLDGEFVRWILWDGRSRAQRRRYAAIRRQYAGKLTVLKNQRQLSAYYREKGLG